MRALYALLALASVACGEGEGGATAAAAPRPTAPNTGNPAYDAFEQQPHSGELATVAALSEGDTPGAAATAVAETASAVRNNAGNANLDERPSHESEGETAPDSALILPVLPDSPMTEHDATTVGDKSAETAGAASADTALIEAARPGPSQTISPAAMALVQALESFETLQARFRQRVEDSRGTLLREATGTLEASRPERFRWEVETPFSELLVGDGRTLWLWDPDLEQLTIRPYDDRLAQTPARLLSGSAAEVVNSFDITARVRTEQRSVYELRPLAGEGLFERLDIILAGSAPRALVVHDSLGQRTEVLFEDVGVDVDIADDRFTFEIPEGADVLREDFADRGADG